VGLNARFLQLMVWLKQQEGIAPGQKVIEIGAQQLNNNFLAARADIDRLAKLFGVPTPDLPSPVGAGPGHMLHSEAPLAGNFYRSLGFDYSCIDIDGTPGSIPLDLNCDPVPSHLVGQFHLVTNYGTTEHVTNQLNAFKVIHDLAAPGAVMLHELPGAGQINHGFFAYHPKFFERLAQENGYSILFADYDWSKAEPGLPEGVAGFVSDFVDITKRPEFLHSQSALIVMLRKVRESPFVTPIDR
jgi:hypothetical protein